MNDSKKVTIARGEHSFACAHFLVDMGKCERLHGHNYGLTVSAGGQTGANGVIIDFNVLGPIVKEAASGLDHKVLIAENENRHELTVSDKEIEVTFKDKRYVFPKEDVVLLPLDSTTVEKLSGYLLGVIAEKLGGGYPNISWLEVGVSEGGSQTAFTRRELG